MSVNYIPKGYHSVTPYLLTKDVNRLIEFLQTAFSAALIECVRDQNNHITHAEVKIGDSIVMMGAKADTPPSASMLYLYIEDVDSVYRKAIQAGARSLKEPEDQFYGDRNAGIQDPCGNQWWIATHIEDLSKEEIDKRAQAFYARQAS